MAKGLAGGKMLLGTGLAFLALAFAARVVAEAADGFDGWIYFFLYRNVLLPSGLIMTAVGAVWALIEKPRPRPPNG